MNMMPAQKSFWFLIRMSHSRKLLLCDGRAATFSELVRCNTSDQNLPASGSMRGADAVTGAG
jgi:hypothetical protein